jgi:hypothetical protein
MRLWLTGPANRGFPLRRGKSSLSFAKIRRASLRLNLDFLML